MLDGFYYDTFFLKLIKGGEDFIHFMHNYSYGVKVRHFSKKQSVKVAKNTCKCHCIDFSVFLESVFETGTEVGKLARGIFGDYIDVTVKKDDGSLDIGAMLNNTEDEIIKAQM